MHERVIQNSFVPIEYFIKWLSDVLIKDRNKFLMLLLFALILPPPLSPSTQIQLKSIFAILRSSVLILSLSKLVSHIYTEDINVGIKL